MTVSDDALAAAFHFEGKLHAFRKAASGIVVSFVLDPADVPPQIALAPLGARYTLALVERGDNEEPVTRDPNHEISRSAVEPALRCPENRRAVEIGPTAAPQNPAPLPESRPSSSATGNGSSAGAHEHSPPGPQCFAWTAGKGVPLRDPARSMAGKARYAESDDMERAVARATGILPKDPKFQAWAAAKCGLPATAEVAASVIRAECGVGSRKEIGISERAYQAFRALETDFLISIGRLPEPR